MNVDDTASGAPNSERIVILGRVGGAFGVAGWVKIQSYTDPPGNLLKYPVWLLRSPHAALEQEWTAMRCLQGRVVTGAVQAQLEGVTTRDHAARLSGVQIGVRRCELPSLPQGEFYWDDLVGLKASSIDGEQLGRIDAIQAMPAHPLLRIVERSTMGGKPREMLVPLVRGRIKSVDLAAGRIVLDWQRDW